MKKNAFWSEFVGQSSQIQKIKKDLIPISKSNLPVLIFGETGTGKSLIAKTLHNISNRNNYPFIRINISSIPSNLMLSELMGHEAGAFSGAKTRKIGLFELASKGTIFLDEIGNADIDLQTVLIRTIDNNTIMRIGGKSEIKINARIISATNKFPLDENYSNDLLLRLTPFKVYIPPLRERNEDIPLLINYFLNLYNKQYSRKLSISLKAIQLLSNYNFPGNVRELQNILLRLVAVKENNEIVTEDFKDILKNRKSRKRAKSIRELKEELENVKKEYHFLKKTTISANPIWQGKNFSKENSYCFILMPFEEENDMQVVYKDHVKKVVENKCALRCERVDDIYGVSGIMQSVWESINKAKIIVADLTNRNPNVFYELGIAHTLGKPVVMITQSMDYVPFDLRHLKCIVYEYKPKSIKKFETDLEKNISSVLAREQDIDINI
jgi:transcriptional regulator with AAA-type ATPase domain